MVCAHCRRVLLQVTITASDGTSSISNNDYNDAASITFTFTTSEVPVGFAFADVTMSANCAGTGSNALAGSGTEYTVTCQAVNGADVTAGVALNKFKDAAGNDNSASSPATFTVKSDTTDPTITITASGDGTTTSISSGGSLYNDASTYTFSFELSDAPLAPTSFSLGDITAPNCLSPTGTAALVTVDSTHFTLLCLANDGALIEVKAGKAYQFLGYEGAEADGFTDAAGNPNAASNVFQINSDTTAPTVTITASDGTDAIADGDYNDASSITFTFTLSDSTTDFLIADLTKSSTCGGSLGGSGTAYTLVCTSSDGNDVTAGVAINKYPDAAGNQNTASSPSTYTVKSDTTVPTVTITAKDQAGASISSGTSNDASVITFTFTLSEVPVPAGSFDETDITKLQCNYPTTLSTFAATNIAGTTYELVCAANNGQTISMTVAANKFKDAAGNDNSAVGSAFTVASDTTPPTVTITASDGTNPITAGTSNKAASITFSFALSEAPGSSTTFAEVDITEVGCDSNTFAGSAQAFTVICTANSAVTGQTTSMLVAAAGFKDAAGNDNTASSLFSFISDKIGPTPSMTAVDSAGNSIANDGSTNSNKIRFIITLDELAEPTSSFAIGDLTIGSNCASTTRIFEHQGGTKYSLECDSSNGNDLTLATGTGGFTDKATTDNQAGVVSGTADNSFTITSDTVAPYVTITATDGTNAILSGATDLSASITFKFELSETASGNTFVYSDILKSSSCGGSSISGAGTNGDPHLLVCSANTGNDLTVSVPANAFTDAASNGNTASGTFTIASDQTLPTVLISASDVNGPILTTGYSRADTITFTFDLSEPAAQVAHSAAVAANAGDTFVLGDVTAPNCDNPLFTGTDRVYKLRCDASNDAVSVSVAAGSGNGGFKDAAGNLNAQGVAVVVNSDTVAPYVTITASDGSAATSGQVSSTAGSTAFTFTFTITETNTVADFDINDITMTNCASVSSLSGGGPYTLTCGANDGFDVSAQVVAGKFSDNAGNFNADSNKFIITSDTTAPTVTITATESSGVALASGDGTAFSVLFKFTLLESSETFALEDVTENCPSKSFWGDKALYYMNCSHTDSLSLSVNVAINTFTDLGGTQNSASSTFTLTMT